MCIGQVDSEWRSVSSGVPQGSVLGPVLFLIYINDLDNNLISKLSKFADDTKLCKSINSLDDMHSLQNDLDRLHEWSVKWQMTFNVDKCVVMHVGSNNVNNSYVLGNQELKSSNKEKDVGVIMDSTFNFSDQCNK